jgi:hypothetical protein
VAATPVPARTTRLIGRDVEMQRLAGLLDHVMAGNGRVLFVAGEAGIGKTRLVQELAVRAQRAGARLVIGHSYPSDERFALGAWVDALRAHVIGDGALVAGLDTRWRAELATLVPEIAEPGAEHTRGDPMRLFEAVSHLVEHLAAATPLVLVLEDAHWADEATLQLFAFIARRVPRWPVLLVVTARDEDPEHRRRLQPVLTELLRAGALQQQTLAPLTREDTDGLARALWPAALETDVARVLDAAWRASEGNPLALVETVRAFSDGTLDARTPESGLPPLVRMLIGQRLDGLDLASRRVLDVAAVLGRTFELTLLRRAAGEDLDALLTRVEDLVRRRILEDLPAGLRFSHDRICEVAYDAILPVRRRVLHGTIAEAIEALYADRLDDHVHALAGHCRESGAWDKAVRFFCRAGRVAVMRGAARQGVGCYDEALAALEHVADGPARLAMAVDVRIGYGNALIPLGEGDRIAHVVSEAQALCERLEDRGRLANVLGLKTRYAVSWQDPPDVLAVAEHAQTVSATGDDPEQAGDAAYGLSLATYIVGDVRRAAAIARDLIARGLDRTRPDAMFTAPREVLLRAVLARALAELGEFAEADAAAAEARALAESRHSVYASFIAEFAAGVVLLRRDDAGAAEAFGRATAIGGAAGYTPQLGVVASAGIAFANARLGAAADVLPALERLARRAIEGRLRLWLTLPSLWLAEAYLLAGRLGDARRQTEATLGLVAGRRERSLEAGALWLLGEVLGRADPGGLAGVRAYEGALAIADGGGLRPLQARCHLGLGRLHARNGQAAAARDAHARARELFSGMHLPVPHGEDS